MSDSARAPWIRLQREPQPWLASLDLRDGTMTLRLTDLENVWTEVLDASQVGERGRASKCIVQLDTPGQIREFHGNLRNWLPQANLDAESMRLAVEHNPGIGTIKYSFTPHILPSGESRKQIKELIQSLYGVIENLGAQLVSQQKLLQGKSFHIRSMADALQRAVDYTPRSHKESYDESFQEHTEPQYLDRHELAVRYWPQHARLESSSPSLLAQTEQSTKRRKVGKPVVSAPKKRRF